MTTITWPSSLPQNNVNSNFSTSPNNGILRTEMSTGYSKVRRRFTKVYRRYTVSYEIDREQYYTFMTFFEYDLGWGVLNFNLPDPLKLETTIECRIVCGAGENPYQITPLSDTDDLVLTFVVEKL